MVSALLTGIFGSVLTYWVGARYFGFGLLDAVWVVAASNFSGFFSLLLILAVERRPRLRKVLLGSSFKTWSGLTILYAAGVAALDPALRDPWTLVCLLAPSIWTTGFMLPLWGRAQDGVVRWEHRRAQARARRSATPPRYTSSKQQFARPERDVIRVES